MPTYKAYHGRAYIYMIECLYDDGLREVDKAIAMKKDDIEGYTLRGRIYLFKRETYKAQQDFKTVLQIDPDNAKAMYGLGLCEYLYRNPAMVKYYYQKATKIEPDNIFYLFQLAVMQYSDGNFNEAVSNLNKAIHLNPKDDLLKSKLLISRAMVKTSMKNYIDAIEDNNKALKLTPRDPTLMHNIGMIYFFKNKFKIAIIYMEKALQLNEEFSAAYFNRGRCYYELHKYIKAYEDFGKACTLNYKGACYWANYLKVKKAKKLNLKNEE